MITLQVTAHVSCLIARSDVCTESREEEKKRKKEEEEDVTGIIKWSAASLYSGGADTVS